jgi:hypothetical protein
MLSVEMRSHLATSLQIVTVTASTRKMALPPSAIAHCNPIRLMSLFNGLGLVMGME